MAGAARTPAGNPPVQGSCAGWRFHRPVYVPVGDRPPRPSRAGAAVTVPCPRPHGSGCRLTTTSSGGVRTRRSTWNVTDSGGGNARRLAPSAWSVGARGPPSGPADRASPWPLPPGTAVGAPRLGRTPGDVHVDWQGIEPRPDSDGVTRLWGTSWRGPLRPGPGPAGMEDGGGPRHAITEVRDPTTTAPAQPKGPTRAKRRPDTPVPSRERLGRSTWNIRMGRPERDRSNRDVGVRPTWASTEPTGGRRGKGGVTVSRGTPQGFSPHTQYQARRGTRRPPHQRQACPDRREGTASHSAWNPRGWPGGAEPEAVRMHTPHGLNPGCNTPPQTTQLR